jgi:hypothetical protein
MLLDNTAPPFSKNIGYDSIRIVINIGKSDTEYGSIYYDPRNKRANLYLNKKR